MMSMIEMSAWTRVGLARPVILPTDAITGGIDTDSPQGRYIRIRNQAYVESNIGSFRHLSFLDRTTSIRKGLFEGFSNLRGYAVDQYRTKNFSADDQMFVDVSKIDGYMTGLGRLVDSVQPRIEALPQEQQQAAAFRLGAVIFSLAIPTHPYIDGNGQNFKMVMLSYLHQFGADHDADGRQVLFPYRLAATSDNRQFGNMIIHASVYSPEVGTVRLETMYRAFRYDLKKNDTRFLNVKRRDTEFPDLVERERLLQLSADIKSDIKNSSVYSRQKMEGYLDHLLSPEGAEVIAQYILDGDQKVCYRDGTTMYQKAFLEFISQAVTRIANSMETKSLHERSLVELLGED